MTKIKTGVVGVGHMGINHARIYSEIEGAALAAVYDSNGSTARSVAEKFQTKATSSLEEFASLVDAATICIALVIF